MPRATAAARVSAGWRPSADHFQHGGHASWATMVRHGGFPSAFASISKRGGLASPSCGFKGSSSGANKGLYAMGQGQGFCPPHGAKNGSGQFKGTGISVVPTALNVSSMVEPVTVTLTEEVEKEMDHNVRVFSGLGLIGCFRGVWPSLGDLHKWIFVHWKPIVTSCVQIYPHARGFFVVVFENETDRNKILCDSHWCWEDSRPLMLS
ncbi:hypothetical protein SUGI_0129800 [Cryptomeria japonica]|nr:hypothetical protein SUGI_0129800 [Cryptomeria japonica]